MKKEKNTKRKKILRNRAQCLKCMDIIESVHRHDFVGCSCGTIYVDGGKDYLRRVGKFNYLKELSEYEDAL